MITKSIKPSNNSGFSLIETLVAITVLLSAVSGVLFLVKQSVDISTVVGDDVVAFYLAQEPIEYIRAVRDGNKLFNIKNPPPAPQRDWLEGLRSECVSSLCEIDIGNNSVSLCPGGVCSNILLDPNGFYNYSAGQATKFVRTTIITEDVANREATIEVNVYWPERGRTKNFSLRETIFNW